MRGFFAALPDAPDLSRAERTDKIVGYIDYGIVRREPTPQPGLALVGDAALTCDPVMAIGCGFALQSGTWLADSVAPALTGEQPLRTALRRYRREHRRRLNGHHRMLTADARAHDFNPVQRLLFAAAARDAPTAATLHRYSERSLPPRRLLSPRVLARAAHVNARARGRSSSGAVTP